MNRAALALALVTLFAAPVSLSGELCSRIVAVGDLHGAYEPFVEILVRTEIVSEELEWTGGDACLVQLGDLVDRGPDSRRLIDLLIDLQEAAPGKVHVLMGNHEAMHLAGDLRYVDPGEVAAFAGGSNPERREREFREYRELGENAGLDEEAIRERFEDRFPPGWFARIDAFRPDGRYGRWLLDRPAAVVLDGTLFVHAGLTLDDARRGIEEINRGVGYDLVTFITVRDRLVEIGLLERLDGLKVQIGKLTAWLAEEQGRLSEAVAAGLEYEAPPGTAEALEFYRLTEGDFLRLDGPLWYRGLVGDDSAEVRKAFKATLKKVRAKRMVVAHTPRKSTRIESRFGNRLFLIDTGAAPVYGGRISALEIRNGDVRAVYLDVEEAFTGEWNASPMPANGD